MIFASKFPNRIVDVEPGLTLADRPFIVYETNDWGAWIRSNTAQQHYVLGRVYQLFSDDDAKLYAVSLSNEIRKQVDYKIFQQQVDKLSWSGSGTAVGWEIVSNWHDGTDGWFCIPHDNQLGLRSVAIPIKTEGSRGMDVRFQIFTLFRDVISLQWSLYVTYIPDNQYINAGLGESDDGGSDSDSSSHYGAA